MSPPHDHAHAHDHAHPGHIHGRGIEPGGNARRLGVALGLIVAFMAAEVVAGVLAHSLALFSDAAHMLTDAAALALALVAARLATRPPGGGLTFGLRRIEILSALVNATMLLVLGALVVYEAIRRLMHPAHVHGAVVLAVAVAGIGVNLLATWQLARANRESLNIRASYQHVLTDLYAFIATGVAAGVILTTGFLRADALASLVVAGLMLHASVHLLRAAVRVLLEAAPEGMDPGEIGDGMQSHPCVTNVHDLHVWEITSGFPALAAHVLVRPGTTAMPCGRSWSTCSRNGSASTTPRCRWTTTSEGGCSTSRIARRIPSARHRGRTSTLAEPGRRRAYRAPAEKWSIPQPRPSSQDSIPAWPAGSGEGSVHATAQALGSAVPSGQAFTDTVPDWMRTRSQ